MNYGRRKKVGFSRKDIFFKYEVDPRYITSKKQLTIFFIPQTYLRDSAEEKPKNIAMLAILLHATVHSLIIKLRDLGRW